MPDKIQNTAQPIKAGLLAALKKNSGDVDLACKAVGIERSTYNGHYKSDPAFRVRADDITQAVLYATETKLLGLIKKGNVAAIMIYLAAKGTKRGYHAEYIDGGSD